MQESAVKSTLGGDARQQELNRIAYGEKSRATLLWSVSVRSRFKVGQFLGRKDPRPEGVQDLQFLYASKEMENDLNERLDGPFMGNVRGRHATFHPSDAKDLIKVLMDVCGFSAADVFQMAAGEIYLVPPGFSDPQAQTDTSEEGPQLAVVAKDPEPATEEILEPEMPSVEESVEAPPLDVVSREEEEEPEVPEQVQEVSRISCYLYRRDHDLLDEVYLLLQDREFDVFAVRTADGANYLYFVPRKDERDIVKLVPNLGEDGVIYQVCPVYIEDLYPDLSVTVRFVTGNADRKKACISRGHGLFPALARLADRWKVRIETS